MSHLIVLGSSFHKDIPRLLTKVTDCNVRTSGKQDQDMLLALVRCSLFLECEFHDHALWTSSEMKSGKSPANTFFFAILAF